MVLSLGVPVPIFVSVYNTLPASVYIIDRIFPGGRPPVTLLQLVSASVTLVTASVLVVTQVGLDFSDSAYFWLVVGVICSVTYTLHCRFEICVIKRQSSSFVIISSSGSLMPATAPGIGCITTQCSASLSSPPPLSIWRRLSRP